jgi:hypothetical protein
MCIAFYDHNIMHHMIRFFLMAVSLRFLLVNASHCKCKIKTVSSSWCGRGKSGHNIRLHLMKQLCSRLIVALPPVNFIAQLADERLLSSFVVTHVSGNPDVWMWTSDTTQIGPLSHWVQVDTHTWMYLCTPKKSSLTTSSHTVHCCHCWLIFWQQLQVVPD